MTKADILALTDPGEIWEAIKANPDIIDAEVAEHFNRINRERHPKEWDEPDAHYEVGM